MRRRSILVAFALASSWGAWVACAREPERPRGAVLVLIDTLRADRLGCYGYERRPNSPRIDALAREGTLFETAVSHAPWTLPSVVSILTGFPDTRAFDGELQRSLVSELSAAGVRTAAFTEGGYFTDQFGLGLGFEEFHEEHYLFGGSIERTFAAALAWLEEHRDERFFLLVHTYEAHMPYEHGTFAEGLASGRLGADYSEADQEEVEKGELVLDAEELACLEALYDGGVRACDEEVGRLLERLEELGLDEHTLVVLTSDHGEELSEGRFPRSAGDHGHALFDYLVHVPLIVRDPSARVAGGTRVSEQVRSMDVLPTVLERLGVPVPQDIEGRALTPFLDGREAAARVARGGNAENGPEREFLRWGGFKLVRRLEEPEPGSPYAHLAELELYDLVRDPREERNVSAERAELVLALIREMEDESSADALDPEALVVPPELEERLRALGYGR